MALSLFGKQSPYLRPNNPHENSPILPDGRAFLARPTLIRVVVDFRKVYSRLAKSANYLTLLSHSEDPQKDEIIRAEIVLYCYSRDDKFTVTTEIQVHQKSHD